MKKIVAIFLSVMIICSLVGCSKSNENNISSPDEIATYNANIESTKLRFGLNGDNGEYIEAIIPSAIEDVCVPSYSSDFKEGWMKITVGATDVNNPLFTIYASTNESYKDFEKEKNYKILGTDGIYTVVWYEHKLSDNLTDEVKVVISEIETYYTLIQETITIKTSMAE